MTKAGRREAPAFFMRDGRLAARLPVARRPCRDVRRAAATPPGHRLRAAARLT
ncbi:hypothetical protein LC55x_3149 [Lysobacter capsici]|nr:hypothetical protein LC55x_3149 [Lysobacter capsici]